MYKQSKNPITKKLENVTLTQIIDHPKYEAEYSEDMVGYILTFKNGKVAHTQFWMQDNKLDADHGEIFLERYDEYDTIDSDEDIKLVEKFIHERNHSKEF